MKSYALSQADRPVAQHVFVAGNCFSRFKGLMFRKSLPAGEGLFLKNCSAIHCCFMRFPIDAVYLDKGMRVVAVETVKPWRLGGIYPGARHVLELSAGAGRDLVPGMPIKWKERAEI